MNRLIELASEGRYSDIANSLISPTLEVLELELAKEGLCIREEKKERIRDIIYIAGAIRAVEIHKLLLLDNQSLKTKRIQSISEKIASGIKKSLDNKRFSARVNITIFEDKDEICRNK